MDFDFNLKPCLNKLNLRFPPLLQFQIEPYISAIHSPNANVETGVAFLFKFGLLPATSKIQPYIKFGAGLSFMSLHTREQSTQFNFIEPGALGVHYFFKKNTALTVEGRFRHLSNCGIKEPNRGINANFFLVGFARRF
jgi:predicted porin